MGEMVDGGRTALEEVAEGKGPQTATGRVWIGAVDTPRLALKPASLWLQRGQPWYDTTAGSTIQYPYVQLPSRNITTTTNRSMSPRCSGD